MPNNLLTKPLKPCSKDVLKPSKPLLATDSTSPFSTLATKSTIELQLHLQATMVDSVVAPMLHKTLINMTASQGFGNGERQMVKENNVVWLSIVFVFLWTFKWELVFNFMGNHVYKGWAKTRTVGEFVTKFSQVLTISVDRVSWEILASPTFQIPVTCVFAEHHLHFARPNLQFAEPHF